MTRCHSSLVLLTLMAAQGCDRQPVSRASPDGASPSSPDSPSPSESFPSSDATIPSPCGQPTWTCSGETCRRNDESGGLPVSGSDWKCSLATLASRASWICYGRADTDPTDCGWSCDRPEGEDALWRCKKPDDADDHPPLSGKHFACMKGSAVGGTRCDIASGADSCNVGEKRWCDGLQYSGWGQVACDPATRKWKMVWSSHGTETLACEENAEGRRPNTVCACYHFYFNPHCCERPDCVVPPGGAGQLCPTSSGRLCSYCNPQKPTCAEPGARCVITNSHESFCARLCDAATPCPGGYHCQAGKMHGVAFQQCVPDDFSCYF